MGVESVSETHAATCMYTWFMTDTLPYCFGSYVCFNDYYGLGRNQANAYGCATNARITCTHIMKGKNAVCCTFQCMHGRYLRRFNDRFRTPIQPLETFWADRTDSGHKLNWANLRPICPHTRKCPHHVEH